MKKLLSSTFFSVTFLAVLACNLWGAEFCVNNESSLKTSLNNAVINGDDNVIKVEQGTSNLRTGPTHDKEGHPKIAIIKPSREL